MTIVLIAGLWLTADTWDAVADRLRGDGHRVTPVALPGQDDRDRGATLDDQLAAVLAAVDAADDPVLVVGHSAACGLAWLAADARPDRVARVAMVGGFPSPGGATYFDALPVVDGAVPFPGWEPFAGPDSADLDAAARDRFAKAAVPVPVGVTGAVVTYRSPRRHTVPVTLVCPEFSAADARGWVAGGDLPELADANVDYVDIDTGHWPMITDPAGLAVVLGDTAAS